MKYCIIYCTAPDKNSALKISRELVKQKLAACCSIIPYVISVYEWRGDLNQENEVLMIIKTRAELFSRLKEAVLKMHPYEVPEIISIPVTLGSEPYLNWINEQTRG